MTTTLSGQLYITLLVEMFILNVPECLVIQTNTDGITVKIKREYLDLFYDLCKQWEEKTKLELEYVEYNRMYIRDVSKLAS